MKLRNLFIASAMLLGVLAAVAPAQADLVGIQVTVQLDTGGGFVTQGVATGGAAGASTPFVVTASAGNTLRMIVQYDATYTSIGYGTSIVTDDPTELDLVNGSAVDLRGSGFAGLAGNPNNSLNDGTPASGGGNSAATTTIVTQDLYRLDFVVQAGVVSDGSKDFTVNLTSIGTGNTVNTANREASVRVDAPAGVPEPSSVLLLGSGLAALAGLVRRR